MAREQKETATLTHIAAVYGYIGAKIGAELSESRRDPNDWPTVACALALSAGIWTNDNDFLGTGIPTWTTDTLQIWLDRNPEGEKRLPRPTKLRAILEDDHQDSSPKAP